VTWSNRRLTARKTAVGLVLTAVVAATTGCSGAGAPPTGSAAQWGSQDGSFAAALLVPCGPRPSGTNSALGEMLAAVDGTSVPALSYTPSALVPAPGGKLFDFDQIALAPPSGHVKPLACASDALAAASSARPDVSAVKEIWLGELIATVPAGLVHGVTRPFFDNTLAWVVVTDARYGTQPCTCPLLSPGSTETAFIDANTGQRLFATGADYVFGPAM
jgi:hypothetical protein